jgi:hypothetical protein
MQLVREEAEIASNIIRNFFAIFGPEGWFCIEQDFFADDQVATVDHLADLQVIGIFANRPQVDFGQGKTAMGTQTLAHLIGSLAFRVWTDDCRRHSVHKKIDIPDNGVDKKTVTTIETMESREESTINSALGEYGKPFSYYRL